MVTIQAPYIQADHFREGLAAARGLRHNRGWRNVQITEGMGSISLFRAARFAEPFNRQFGGVQFRLRKHKVNVYCTVDWLTPLRAEEYEHSWEYRSRPLGAEEYNPLDTRRWDGLVV